MNHFKLAEKHKNRKVWLQTSKAELKALEEEVRIPKQKQNKELTRA